MSNIKVNNGTGNANLGEKSIAIGQGCVTIGNEQTALGRYPEIPTGDSTSDALVIGAGKSQNERSTVLRVTKDGEILNGGGGPVYMLSPDTGDLIPVYMLGTNNRYKQVNLSK